MTHAFNEEDVREKDVVEEVHFEIDKDAFKGPFVCCHGKTTAMRKTFFHRVLETKHAVWSCHHCKKEYLDTEQAKLLESFWSKDETAHHRKILG